MKEVLESSRAAEYFTPEGLRTLTGLPESLWLFAIFKELVDNALDAVDLLTMKRVDLEVGDGFLAVYDSGPGIPRETLERIYNFDCYVSSNREYRTCSRGLQGNALKTVIAVCYLSCLELKFLSSGRMLTYNVDPAMLTAGIVRFECTEEPVEERRSGVIISGCHFSADEVSMHLWTYHLSNPDVTFSLNGSVYRALQEPVSRSSKTFVHWYDLVKFNQLLQAVTIKDPKRTAKQFCLAFSGTQRLMSRFEFPNEALGDFHADAVAVEALYEELKEKVKRPTPKILSRQITGKQSLLEAFGGSEDCKYKVVYSEYADDGATIPYVIEGFLLMRLSRKM